jgi:signal transduction histidine kinase/DNA-binding response OmpR family regulator
MAAGCDSAVGKVALALIKGDEPAGVISEELRLRQDAQQIAMMYRLSRTTRYFPLGLLSTLLVVFWDSHPLWIPVTLFLTYLGSTYLFDVLRSAYRRSPPPVAEAGRWGRYFAAASVASGAVWGLAGWFYFTPENPAALSFLSVLLTAIATSSVVSRAGYLPSFYAYSLTVMVPYVLRSIVEWDVTFAAFGMLMSLYYVGIAVWAHSFSRQQREDLGLRTQNSELVVQLRAALDEAERARAAAEAAGDAKTDFLATISHELRTPLNGILGMAGLLIGTRLDSQQRAFAEAVRRSGESLLAIIDDILDFSKLEADRVTLEQIDFDLREVSSGVVELMAPRAHAKGLEIDSYFSQDAPDVLLGDPARLRQVLMNLVGNAVKFTDAGWVTVAISRVGEKDGVPVLRFDVTDTGIGVPEQALPHLFTRFRQGDASITRRYGGTGLGLAIAKRLVEAMGGEIGVVNVPYGGCRFWFTVPMREVAVASQRLPPLSDMRVALVSDNPAPDLTERKLRDLGADPVPAPPDVDSILALHPQAVLFDVADAGQRATELAMAIRRRNQAPRLVLAVRAGMAASAEPGAEDAFDHRLLKPFRRTALAAAMTPRLGVPAPKLSSRPAGAGKLRILVADDIEVNRDLLQALLQGYGHRVDVVGDGQAALTRAQSGVYDLIFMDLEMPVLHGLAAAAAIRQLPGAPGRVAVIGVTAHMASDQEERCRAAGMDDFLGKPIDPKRLEAVLHRWRRPESRAPGEGGEVATTAAVPQPSEALIINEVTLDALELRVGRAKSASLVGDFATDLRRRIERFAPAAEAADWDALRREGHILKGLAGNFGLPRLSELGEALVRSTRTANKPLAQELAQLIVSAAYDALERLDERYPELRPKKTMGDADEPL